MTNTTVKRMDLVYATKRPARINGKVPAEVKQVLIDYCNEIEISESQFLNEAVVEKLENLGKL